MDYNETIANLEDDIYSLLERNKELEEEIKELKRENARDREQFTFLCGNLKEYIEFLEKKGQTNETR